MVNTVTPLRYPGGKSQFYSKVKNIISNNGLKHLTYVEPFAGGAGVAIRLLLEGVVENIIINDVDYAIYSFWKTIINDCNWLIEKIKNITVNIEEWNKQKYIYLHPDDFSQRELAFSVLFLNRCNRSGILSAGPIGGKKQNGNYKIDCRFNKDRLVSQIRAISFFKKRIKVYNYDASFLLKKLKNEKNLFWFIDPPYYLKGSELYKNFFEHPDHVFLSNTIKRYLNNQSWILTYDVCDEIYQLYESYSNTKISLTYSVENKRKEFEFLFYNNLTIDERALL